MQKIKIKSKKNVFPLFLPFVLILTWIAVTQAQIKVIKFPHVGTQTCCHFNVTVQTSHHIDARELKNTNLSLNRLPCPPQSVCEERRRTLVMWHYIYQEYLLFLFIYFPLSQPERPLLAVFLSSAFYSHPLVSISFSVRATVFGIKSLWKHSQYLPLSQIQFFTKHVYNWFRK